MRVKLAIADPPYPPMRAQRDIRPRASRWYGDNQQASDDMPADFHPAADEWDAPERHRQLLLDLMASYDGWAIATSPDGLAAYGELPAGCRIMAWVKPNSQPGAHRLISRWEPVITYPPRGRRSNRGGIGGLSDVLIAPGPGRFIGAKPPKWTRWVLDALSYDPENDSIEDLFGGSGSVSMEIAQGVLI